LYYISVFPPFQLFVLKDIEYAVYSFFFNNNDFIRTAELDYCTEVDQPFLEGLLRGNSQLARQA
jgi:hypothetical protein